MERNYKDETYWRSKEVEYSIHVHPKAGHGAAFEFDF
jgi:hypothetical protein